MDKSQYIQPRDYELMLVLIPDQPEAETKAAVDKVVSYITDQKGEITSIASDSPWGRRRLAYTVRHENVDYRDGYYVLAYFNALPSVLTEIERELKLDVNVIRYLLLSYDENMGEKIEEGAEADIEEGAEDDAAVAAETEASDDSAETAVEEAVTSDESTDAEVDVATDEPVEEVATEDEEAPAAE